MTSHLLFFGLLFVFAVSAFIIITTAAFKPLHPAGYILAIIFGSLGLVALILWNMPEISIDFSKAYIYGSDTSVSQWKYAAPLCNASLSSLEKILTGMMILGIGIIYVAAIIVGASKLVKLSNSD